ncbi:MAG: UDP-N-acetylmuramoyl-L-alanine--D-glutamate ligase [Clostridia bacterium]|nr:UDP-N-acetylmuramoyl-L-alanine--D-glutamate ligase [Clostridia bacterium]
MNLKRDKFLIVGISKSGVGATELLLKRGAKCYIYDDNDNDSVKRARETLSAKGAVAVSADELEETIETADIVVLSPGVAIDHEIPVKAKRAGKRIIGELELASLFCQNPIIAVTGTNGKTTTCSLIDCILKGAGIDCVLCGNIGTPLSSVLDRLKEDSVVVAEVSSFQLETVSKFTPHIAVVTNVTPDHLARHYNMENYIFVKSRILQCQRESEYAVLNYDDPIVRKMAEKAKSKVVYFSVKSEVDGAYLSGEKILYKGKYVMDSSAVQIGGQHNIENVLAAVCAAEIMGVTEEKIAETILGFKGVKHRIQFVKEIGGVEYYNDSKATNPDASIKAIDSMKRPTVLILGGKDKGLSFDELFDKIKKSCVYHVVLTGESRLKMAENAISNGFNAVSMTEDFVLAIKLAKMIAKEGDAVLLSPACSSYDKFSDFEERGDKFIETVENLDER